MKRDGKEQRERDRERERERESERERKTKSTATATEKIVEKTLRRDGKIFLLISKRDHTETLAASSSLTNKSEEKKFPRFLFSSFTLTFTIFFSVKKPAYF